MATNITQGSQIMTESWTNGTGSDVSSGAIVAIGGTGTATLAVATVDIADGATGEVAYNCIVTAPKVSAAVFTQGEGLLWDKSAGKFDDNAATAASGDVLNSARAVVAGANTETTCSVLLTGNPGTLTA